MTDVIERLRAAEDRTQPPGPFDLAAATRAGQARRRRRRGTWVAGIAGIAAAVVVGSVFTWAGSGTPAEVADTPAHPLQDVDALLGEWSVHGLEPSDSLEEVRLSVTEDLAVVSTSCLSGYLWAAHPDGLMLMDPTLPLVLMDQIEENDRCEPGFGAPWPSEVAGFHVRSDEQIDLVNGEGDVVAALTRTAPAPPRTRPAPTAALLPEGVEPATEERLEGRWYEAGAGESDRWLGWIGHATSSPGGSRRQWSDGCNTLSSTIAVSPHGGVLVSPVVITTDVFCGGLPDPDPTWPPQDAARAGFDGDALVLFDAAGEELAVLTRDGSAAERTVTPPQQDDPPHDPMALRGKWMLTRGSEASVQVNFGVPTGPHGNMRLPREGCELTAAWSAHRDGLLALSLTQGQGSSACNGAMDAAHPWLAAVKSFRTTSATGAELRDADGAVVASLSRPDGATPPPTQVSQPPVADLPEGMVPATPGALVGTWVAPGKIPTAYYPSLRFDAVGRFHLTDGCNDTGGGWSGSTRGALVMTNVGGITQMGCGQGEHGPFWDLVSAGPTKGFDNGLDRVDRAAFDGAELMLLDTDAVEVTRLVREN